MRGLHEAWFTIVLAMIVLHLGAILFYRLFRKQKLTSAMITGSDDLDPGAVPIRPGKYWVALICLIAGIALTRWIIAGVPPFGG